MSAGLQLILILVLLAAGVAAVLATARAALPAFGHLSETMRLWLGHRSRRIARYTDAVQAEWVFLVVMAIVIVVAAFVFFSIAEDVMEGDPTLALDRATYNLMRTLRTPWGDAVLIAITELGDSVVVTTMGVVVAAWLAWHRAWRPLVFWITAIAGGSILNTAIKVALHRTRPTDLYHASWDAFSFPSGHSTTNAVLYGFLAVLIGRQLPKSFRLPLAYATALLVALIAFSRLYLGAHWLSDVVGGLTFGAAWVAVLAALYVHGQTRDVDSRGLLLLAVATLAIAGGLNMVLHHAHDLTLYAIRVQS